MQTNSLPTPDNDTPTTDDVAPPLQRWLALDFLRGVAILLVIGRHQPLIPSEPAFLKTFAGYYALFGWTGVDMFFVLSGFLIGGLIFAEIKKHGHFDAKRFFIRRLFKIWPAYFLYLTYLLIVLSIVGQSLWFGIRKTAYNWFHIQNYFVSPRSHTWSLAVEEHFYLALPLLIVFFISSRPASQQLFQRIITTGIFLLVTCLLLRWINLGFFPGDTAYMRFIHRVCPTHLRIDSLFVGVMIAALFHLRHSLFRRMARYPVLWILGGILLISPMMFISSANNLYIITIGFTALALGYSAILIGLMELSLRGDWSERFARFAPIRIITGIGALSYGIYLWHLEPVTYYELFISKTFLQEHPALGWVVVETFIIVVGFSFGWLSTQFVERPSLKLRDALFPSLASNAQK